MKQKFSPVTVTSPDGTVTQIPALNEHQLNRVLVPVVGSSEFDFTDYKKTSEWRKRQNGYFSRHKKRCAGCGTKNNVDLHLLKKPKYDTGRDSDVAVLCNACFARIKQLHVARPKASLRQVLDRYISDRNKARRNGIVKERKPGERRERRCSPGLEKPEFIPRNRRGATTDDRGRILSSDRGDDIPTWISH